MTKPIPGLLAEIEELKDRLRNLEAKLEDAKNQPEVFEVVLKVTTRPNSWGDDNIGAKRVLDHFNSYMYELKEALNFDDDGDSIELESVTEVIE